MNILEIIETIKITGVSELPLHEIDPAILQLLVKELALFACDTLEDEKAFAQHLEDLGEGL